MKVKSRIFFKKITTQTIKKNTNKLPTFEVIPTQKASTWVQIRKCSVLRRWK